MSYNEDTKKTVYDSTQPKDGFVVQRDEYDGDEFLVIRAMKKGKRTVEVELDFDRSDEQPAACRVFVNGHEIHAREEKLSNLFD